MEWQVILALAIAIPIILFPAGVLTNAIIAMYNCDWLQEI